MDLKVGQILDGKVTGITKFGAFVSLEGGKSGLVHISEIANSYVSDINDHLTVGQEVKVKLIGIDDTGRINLSIKQAEAKPKNNTAPRKPYAPRTQEQREPEKAGRSQADMSFEDRLKQFMQDSDSKISGLKQYSDKKSSRRRGR